MRWLRQEKHIETKVPGDLYRTKNPLVLRYPHARPNGRLYGGLEISLPKNAIQTATVDRRKEFACYTRMEMDSCESSILRVRILQRWIHLNEQSP